MGKKVRSAMVAVSVFYVILGVIMIVWPDVACNIACYIMGAAGILYGVVEIVNYIRTRDLTQPTGSLLTGIFSFLIGLLFILKAKTIVTVMIAALGIFVVADSVIKLVYTLELKGTGVKPWKVYTIITCVLLLLGVFMLVDPFNSAKFMIICAGVFLLLDGLFNFWMVLQVKNNLNL